jgi:hypothetical protein
MLQNSVAFSDWCWWVSFGDLLVSLSPLSALRYGRIATNG